MNITRIVVDFKSGQCQVSRMEYGQYQPCRNWQQLQEAARSEVVEGLGFLPDHGVFDASPELAARAEW
jgi:hypothetical protein